MSRTTRAQIEGTLTALCKAANLPRAESPGAPGCFIERGPAGYCIRMKLEGGGETDVFGSIGLCESAGVLWDRMSFALSVLGASEHRNDVRRPVETVLQARNVLFPGGDLEHPAGADELGELARILRPS